MFVVSTAAPKDVRLTLRAAQGDEPESFVILDPITPAMRRRAYRAVRAMLERQGITDTSDPDVRGDMGEKVSCELIRMGLKEWHGIGDEHRQPIALTPDQATRLRTANDPDRPTGTIDAALADVFFFGVVDAGYVLADANRLAEKNELSGSPAGTSSGATPAKTTAALAAKRKKTAAARNARTRNTRSRPKKATASSKS